jgi:hypothetical protein
VLGELLELRVHGDGDDVVHARKKFFFNLF